MLEKLQENPLRPFIILWICSIDFSAPVKRNAETFNLLFKPGNVLFRHLCGMDVIFNGIILCWKSKCIPANWIQNIITLHTALSSNNIQRGIRARMPNMQALTRRIRKLNQCIILRLPAVILCVKNARFFPSILPLLFNCFMVVFHVLTLYS